VEVPPEALHPRRDPADNLLMDDAVNLDLALGGGGVRGIALVGALSVLEEAGYRFQRVAGTSAGALVGALVAAGMPTASLHRAMGELDYRRFLDHGGQRLGRVPVLGPGLSLLVGHGLHPGSYLGEWLGGQLERLGVRTFGDLRINDDAATGLAPSRRYRLVVTALDVSRRRLVRLPWDYPDYGLDPDDQLVIDAVRASAALPLLFAPSRLHHGSGATSVLLDGGVVADFPIGLFDRRDGRPSRWPTLGVRLCGPQPDRKHRLRGPLGLGWALLAAVKEVYEERSWSQLPGPERIISIDTSAIGRADFGLDRAAQQALYLAGRRDTAAFLGQRNMGKILPGGDVRPLVAEAPASVPIGGVPALVAQAS
jgi:NTE family protein